jgi:hypothetical protein
MMEMLTIDPFKILTTEKYISYQRNIAGAIGVSRRIAMIQIYLISKYNT